MKQVSEHFIADEHGRGNVLALWFWAEWVAEEAGVSVQVLAPATVRDPDIVRLTREDANARRWQEARAARAATEEHRVKVEEYFAQHFARDGKYPSERRAARDLDLSRKQINWLRPRPEPDC